MGMNTRALCWLALVFLVLAAGAAEAAGHKGEKADNEKTEKSPKAPKETAPTDPSLPEPAPVDPAPVDPAPAPLDPAPVQPAPVDSVPAERAAPDPVAPTQPPVAGQPPPAQSQASTTPPVSPASPDESGYAVDDAEPVHHVTLAPSVHDVAVIADELVAPLTLRADPPQSDAQAGPTIIVRTPAWVAPVMGLFALGAVVTSAALARLVFRPSPVAQMPVLRPVHTPVTAADALRAGQSFVRQGDHEQACAEFTRATRIEPELAVAHFCLGLCLVELGRHHEAVNAFENACALDAKDAEVRVHLARAFARVGQHHAAMDALAPVVRADADLAKAARLDPAFAALLDHPRFLMLTGVL